MNIKKFFFSFIVCSFIFTNISSAENIFSNLTQEQMNIVLRQKMKETQANKNLAPLSLVTEGSLKNQKIGTSLILSESINGYIILDEVYINRDLIIVADKLKKLDIKNSVIGGNIYVIDNMNNMPLTINNSKVNNIYINTSVNLKEIGKNAIIQNIIITKGVKPTTKITIEAYINSLVNNSENSNVVYNGKMNKFVVNKKINFGGKNSYKLKTSEPNAFEDTILYDMNDFKPTKAYSDINDNTSFEDFYNLLRKEQYKNSEKISIIVKNPTENNIKTTNNLISQKLSKYIPNNASAIYAIPYNDNKNKYGVLDIYFVYDTSIERIKQSEKKIDEIFKKIKHLDGIDYIREVNKIIALSIVYDETLTKRSLYDAVCNSDSVCGGYAKMGYELLQRKFGKENNILIDNSDHIWNMIRLGNDWYHIDFTHNDPITKPLDKSYYTEEYLLISDEELVKKSKGRKWDRSNYPKANKSINIKDRKKDSQL